MAANWIFASASALALLSMTTHLAESRVISSNPTLLQDRTRQTPLRWLSVTTEVPDNRNIGEPEPRADPPQAGPAQAGGRGGAALHRLKTHHLALCLRCPLIIWHLRRGKFL